MFESFELFYMEKPSLIGVLTIIIDILLVSYVIYKFLIIVRGTRAFLMVIGLMLLLGASTFFSHYLNLYTIQWLLASFFNYFFLFIVIIFQFEIRRVLTRVGGNMQFGGFINKKQMEAMDEIVEAVDRMSQIKLGGIIVFERTAKLGDELFAGGESVDCKISKEIIWSIFNVTPENPLHDGAITIRSGRIHKAGVLLPLSENKNLKTSMGTRHRAALGISENTDAISLVISEERGTISIAEHGNLTKMENISSLRNELMKLLRQQPLNPEKLGKSTDKPEEAKKTK
jgi:diadenylate cyclase